MNVADDSLHHEYMRALDAYADRVQHLAQHSKGTQLAAELAYVVCVQEQQRRSEARGAGQASRITAHDIELLQRTSARLAALAEDLRDGLWPPFADEDVQQVLTLCASIRQLSNVTSRYVVASSKA